MCHVGDLTVATVFLRYRVHKATVPALNVVRFRGSRHPNVPSESTSGNGVVRDGPGVRLGTGSTMGTIGWHPGSASIAPGRAVTIQGAVGAKGRDWN